MQVGLPKLFILSELQEKKIFQKHLTPAS
jgi:hypothetical protein